MYNNNEIISYLQANRILALKLDHTLAGAGKAVSSQIETIVRIVFILLIQLTTQRYTYKSWK